MEYQARPNNQRRETRVSSALPAQIRIGSQLSVEGRLKDLSLKSAFITMKTNVYLEMNDEVGFAIGRSAEDPEALVAGSARISRIAAGEGLAIYFTRLEDGCAGRLRTLVNNEV